MTPRRTDALSRDRIVEVTIELLDASGADGLTVRAVTDHLATGRGAIYHHVANKEQLLAAATDGVVRRALAEAGGDDPRQAVRALALAIFDTIDAHPWAGAQLSRDPAQPAVLRIWKSLGRRLHDLGVRGKALSDAGSALVNYVLGAAAQHVPDDAARQAYLDDLATRWAQQDADPLVQESAALLREHDDRDQFLAGVDIFLAGVAAKLL